MLLSQAPVFMLNHQTIDHRMMQLLLPVHLLVMTGGFFDADYSEHHRGAY
jgi:hypothetical protein